MSTARIIATLLLLAFAWISLLACLHGGHAATTAHHSTGTTDATATKASTDSPFTKASTDSPFTKASTDSPFTKEITDMPPTKAPTPATPSTGATTRANGRSGGGGGGRGQYRVAHGREAQVGQFPFVVHLGHCTGSILDTTTILTAGHCVCDMRTDNIVAGVVRPEKDYGPTRQTILVKRIFIHSNYMDHCPNDHPDDVAIIKLQWPLQFNRFVQKIDLNCVDPPRIGTEILAMGFGLDENKDSGVLKFAPNRLVQCPYEEGFLCSSMHHNHVDSGDSGGPLVRVIAPGQFQQIAVNGAISKQETLAFYQPSHAFCPWAKQFVNPY